MHQGALWERTEQQQFIIVCAWQWINKRQSQRQWRREGPMRSTTLSGGWWEVSPRLALFVAFLLACLSRSAGCLGGCPRSSVDWSVGRVASHAFVVPGLATGELERGLGTVSSVY